MDTGTIVAIIAAIIIISIVSWCVSARNRFARYEVKITEADSGIDVALTKRYDTLTKMLDVTKGYAKHEAEVLGSIVRLRSGMSISERGEVNHQMDELTDKLSILAEGYPDLKASENYKQLQQAISEAEAHLQASRRIYNMNVSAFNQHLASWPASIIGAAMRKTPQEFFEAEEHKKQDVKMDF